MPKRCGPNSPANEEGPRVSGRSAQHQLEIATGEPHVGERLCMDALAGPQRSLGQRSVSGTNGLAKRRIRRSAGDDGFALGSVTLARYTADRSQPTT
jgi:hypothetical protein